MRPRSPAATYLVTLVVTTLTVLGSCASDGARSRLALRAAWRAYAMRSPTYGVTTADAQMRAVSSESIARFDAEGRASIASLDSALTAIPPGGGEVRRYLRQTLAGLVTTLRDRHGAELFELQAAGGSRVDAYAKQKMMKVRFEADGVADQTILRLAAWERRYLHETCLADSCLSRTLASVMSAVASSYPDSLRPWVESRTVLDLRPMLEGRIALADSVMVAEIARDRRTL